MQAGPVSANHGNPTSSHLGMPKPTTASGLRQNAPYTLTWPSRSRYPIASMKHRHVVPPTPKSPHHLPCAIQSHLRGRTEQLFNVEGQHQHVPELIEIVQMTHLQPVITSAHVLRHQRVNGRPWINPKMSKGTLLCCYSKLKSAFSPPFRTTNDTADTFLALLL
ncbi:hypothetical protein SVAN01_03032 [Stagonosporopsis vannaccii]|nr:hypothetical protein SVAN01_03032 [Stagonosporopsis vannaccii]